MFTSDHVGSDDLEEILAFSRHDVAGSSTPVASSSRVQLQPNGSSKANGNPGGSAYVARQELDARLDSLDAEIASVDEEALKLKELRARLVAQKQDVQRQLENMRTGRSAAVDNSKGKGKGIDYSDEWEWTPDLVARMKAVFGIQSFRLCQQGQCNANMDRRDIVCVMPTGGGKSLTYQLPALFSTGCTVVISPLIALITDQILHLREAGGTCLEAVMLTGATGKDATRNIMARMTAYDPQKSKDEKEIKLCYVTPEKIAKSKTFKAMLEKLAAKGRLARIVIDEAHCVSQLGHDFRPDYKNLSILRQLFPRVPILALSATCPPKVLNDVLKILRLQPVTDGAAANKTGTVYFSSPLYRPNLHYCVMPKPSGAAAAIQAMADYILEAHADDSGIVYCLSKKDTETVAAGLSERGIRSGVYHADIGDEEKERLHVRWRKGQVKVVCATIAFGLGIDKGDVRFVLHHTISKSLEGYYQESGRAGRDGKDADCVLFYRGQDATRLSALVANEPEGQDKVHAMLKFAQDLRGCRKLLFAEYFSAASELALSAWGASTDAGATCGHCDNCKRKGKGTVDVDRDVTLDAWKILHVLSHIEKHKGRVTISILTDLVRGAGGGGFAAGKKGKKAQDKIELDLDAVCGGKVSLSKDDTEILIIHLLTTGHLTESYSQTAYTINVYLTAGPEAYRLSRRSKADAESSGQRVLCDFQQPQKKPRKRASTSRPKAGSKRKRTGQSSGEDEDDAVDDDDDRHPHSSSSKQAGSSNKRAQQHISANLEDDDDDDVFTSTLRRIDPTVLQSSSDAEDAEWVVANARPRKKSRTSAATFDHDVIDISP
ncbi:ATP-dependent DNA helicase [Exidia glandulosa HHB12029]|uniref:ATP-dependent DNA helicase n=1 Tax=Exidia glandulosa HHB12029 TaxID=1314781 RepID=A0A165MPB6_EXIGL|nr:ATP-dependent DNA helicase [Exidia glandulosa HHB12029]